MAQKEEKFKKVVENFIFAEKDDNFLLLLTAIPIFGTIIIILYFCMRRKKVYWVKIK